MEISLVDVDGHNFPNFALMKISAWHKANGDAVDWYSPLFSHPDRIYASKVFTFTPDYDYFPTPHYWAKKRKNGDLYSGYYDPGIEIKKGGTGYRIYEDLPTEIDAMLPDYSIYPQYDFAIGFLSRGCIRNCPWCVVPRKEGSLRKYDDIERIHQGRKHLVLMDNNFLANDFEFIKEQIEKANKLKLSIDFNQGLDARLVTPEIAKVLASAKWRAATGNNGYIRFSCDTMSCIEPVKNAISELRGGGYNGEIFCYILAKEIDTALERIIALTEFDKRLHPFIMPYRNLDGDGKVVDKNLSRLARWCNMASIRKSCKF